MAWLNTNTDWGYLVFDFGSSKSRYGFANINELANYKYPKNELPSIVGRPRYPLVHGMGMSEICVGENVQKIRGILHLNYPIQHGLVVDCDDFEKLIQESYNGLRVSGEYRCVLMAEAPLNPKENREKIAQIMFEKFEVPGLFFASSPVLSMYLTGHTTGIAVEVGHGVTSVAPMHEGQMLTHAVQRSDLAGSFLTDYLMKMLIVEGRIKNPFGTCAEREIIREIKEKLAYVSNDFERENKDPVAHEYELPDGQIIKIGGEAMKCGEALFRPSLLSMDLPGIHELVHDAIGKSEMEDMECKSLYAHVAVFGGTSKMNGFPDRLSKELSSLAPQGTTINVKGMERDERDLSAWMGGSMLLSNSSFHQMWITRQEYDEKGANIVNCRRL